MADRDHEPRIEAGEGQPQRRRTVAAKSSCRLDPGAAHAAPARCPVAESGSIPHTSSSRVLGAADAAAFYVVCSSCDAALRVRLPACDHSIRCDLCSAVFTATVETYQLGTRRHVPHPQSRVPRRLPATLELYNDHTKREIARLTALHPELTPRERFARSVAAWHAAKANAAAEAHDGARQTAGGSPAV